MEPALQALIDELRAAPNWPLASRAIEYLERDLAPGTISRDVPPAVAALEDAFIALLSPPSTPDAFMLDPRAFGIARVLTVSGERPRHGSYWRSKREGLIAVLRPGGDANSAAPAILALALCDAVLDSPLDALGRFLDRVGLTGPERFWTSLPNAAAVVGACLTRAGCFEGDVRSLRLQLSTLGRVARTADTATVAFWVLIVLRLLFITGRPAALLEAVFDEFVVPVLDRAAESLDRQLLDAAQVLDERISSDYLKQDETIERFSRIQRTIAPRFEKIGRCARSLEATIPPAAEPATPVRVGFVLTSDARLAHTETLLVSLRGWSRLPARLLEPIVYVLAPGTENSGLSTALVGLGITLRLLDRPGSHPIVWLRDVAARDHTTALVFVSTTTYVAFAAGYRPAQVLVWWTMKFHDTSVGRIDGYLCCGNFFDDRVIIRGEPWRATRVALPPLSQPDTPAEGAALRASLGWPADCIVLGCIGREEKLANPSYITAIAEVLRANPSARFIWTGRQARRAEVSALIEHHGIADRSRCLGWLANTKAAAWALDIYADSFPFASGFTAFEAMAHGKPVVVLRTPEALETSSITGIAPVVEGRAGRPEHQTALQDIFTGRDGTPLLPYVSTIPDYVAALNRLIRDAAFRSAAGAAGRDYVTRFACDESGFAESTCRHIVELIAEATAPSSIGAKR